MGPKSTTVADDDWSVPEAKEPWALRNGKWIVGLGGALAIIVGLSAVFALPTVDRIVGNFAGGDLQRARADVRQSGLALATGIAAATAGLLAWGRLELSRRQHRLDRQRYGFEQHMADEQHALARESQRSERFVRSVELLGHAHDSVRLGALYALEGLARDGFDRQTVLDVVSAFARSNAPMDFDPGNIEGFEVSAESFDEAGGGDENGTVDIISADDFRSDVQPIPNPGRPVGR